MFNFTITCMSQTLQLHAIQFFLMYWQRYSTFAKPFHIEEPSQVWNWKKTIKDELSLSILSIWLPYPFSSSFHIFPVISPCNTIALPPRRMCVVCMICIGQFFFLDDDATCPKAKWMDVYFLQNPFSNILLIHFCSGI